MIEALSLVQGQAVHIRREALALSVRIAAHDCAGLERVLRHCASSPFALERLELVDAESVVYRLPQPQRDDTTVLSLRPPSLSSSLLIEHIAAELVHIRGTAIATIACLRPTRPCFRLPTLMGVTWPTTRAHPAGIPAPPVAQVHNGRSPPRCL